MKYNLDLTFLRDWQKKFFSNHKLRNVLVVHRRWGKTIVAIVFLLYKALINKGSYWYIAPYRTQSKSIAWEALNKIGKNIPWMEWNISELKCTLPNGSTIVLFGADNQEALRWLDLRGVVLDEYKDINASLYREILAPMINAYKDGWVVYIGTPWGKNQFYDIYEKAKNNDEWYDACLDIHTTWLLDEEQLKRAMEEGTDEHWDDSAFRQEYLLDWDVSSKYSYYRKQIAAMYKTNRLIDGLYDPHLPVYTAWDIGVNDYTTIIFFQYFEGHIRLIDYYENRGEWIGFYYNHLKSLPYVYKRHFLPHDAAAKEWGSWYTRQQTFEDYFWYDTTYVLKRYPVADGINAVRELFPIMLFDGSLVKYINVLSEYQPKLDKAGLPTEHAIHCDVSDTIRYLATAYNDFVKTEENWEVEEIDYTHLI